MALTVKRIKKLANSPGRYSDGLGLYLQVPEAGTTSPRATRASWLFRYERHGRERWLGLGALHTYCLDEARELARKARQQLDQGIDPIDARQADRAAKALEAARALTFEQAATQYFDAHERKWKYAKSRAQFLSSLKAYAFPKIGGLPVVAIDTGLVLKVVEPIWQTKTETASRVRGRIEAVLDWATVRGYRTGDNPARLSKGNTTSFKFDGERRSNLRINVAASFVAINLGWLKHGGDQHRRPNRNARRLLSGQSRPAGSYSNSGQNGPKNPHPLAGRNLSLAGVAILGISD